MRSLAFAILLVALLVVGFLVSLRSGLFQAPPGAASQGLVITPEVAATAEDRVLRLLDGDGPIRLSDSEVTSLLRYRPESWSLGLLRIPTVRIAGDTMHLSGAVDPAALPPHPDLDAVRFFLPDTTRVDVGGRIVALDPGFAGVEITSLEIAGMPFPSSYFPHIVDRLGLPGDDRLPPGSFAFPLPPGVGSARSEGGELVLTP